MAPHLIPLSCTLAFPPPSHRDATAPSPCWAPHFVTQERIMFSNPTPSKPLLSPAATLCSDFAPFVFVFFNFLHEIRFHHPLVLHSSFSYFTLYTRTGMNTHVHTNMYNERTSGGEVRSKRGGRGWKGWRQPPLTKA